MMCEMDPVTYFVALIYHIYLFIYLLRLFAGFLKLCCGGLESSGMKPSVENATPETQQNRKQSGPNPRDERDGMSHTLKKI